MLPSPNIRHCKHELTNVKRFGKPDWLFLRKITCEATQPRKNQPFVDSHVILPNRPTVNFNVSDAT
jgi:hypothetical protein